MYMETRYFSQRMRFPIIVGGIVLALATLPRIGWAQPVMGQSNAVFINFGMPELVLDGDIFFNDINNNNGIDAEENVQVGFFVKNVGKYVANNIRVRTKVENGGGEMGLPEDVGLGNLAPNERKLVRGKITGGKNMEAGKATLLFEIIENDTLAETIRYEVNTFSESQQPKLEIIAYNFVTRKGRKIRKDSPFILNIRLKNTGGGTAKEVSFDVDYPKHILLLTFLEEYKIDELQPGETIMLSFEFQAGINYSKDKIPLRIIISDIGGVEESQELESPPIIP